MVKGPPSRDLPLGIEQIYFVSNVKLACLRDILVRAFPTAILGLTANLDIYLDQRSTAIIAPQEIGVLVAGCKILATESTIEKSIFFAVQKQMFLSICWIIYLIHSRPYEKLEDSLNIHSCDDSAA